ncbi:MAG TPA: hypothetical protein VEX86_06625 [Longimicrobium sp.]|nr:hypothetical protein [Longimicrobium sp.]
MEKAVNWFFSLVRVVGASVPFASSLIQLHAEVDSRDTQKRLQTLEDPISGLHPDVREVSRIIYDRMREADSNRVALPEEMYGRFGRALAVLEANGHIRGTHALGQRFVAGLWVTDSSYIVYLCGLFEDPRKMDRLFQVIDVAKPKQWLKGVEIAQELGLPVAVVKGIFDLYAAKGFGIVSNEIGTANYYAQV